MDVPGVAGVVLVGLVYLQVSKATTCYKYDKVALQNIAFECEEGDVCCGTAATRTCCGNDGTIISIVVGSVVGLSILVIIILCLVKHCNKRSQKGAVIKPYPVNSGGVGAVGTQPHPHKAGPGTRLPPLTHNYIIPPTNTPGVPSTLNDHTVPPIISEPNDVPPPFIYIPPQHARRY